MYLDISIEDVLMESVDLMVVRISEASFTIKIHKSWIKLLRITAREKQILDVLIKVSINKKSSLLSSESLKWT